MTILNQDIEWRELAVNPDIRDAFRGTPTKTLLDPGVMLCRFITCAQKEKKIKGNQIFGAEWWLDWSSAIAEFNRWRASGIGPKEVLRARMAVTTKFNPELEGLAQIILTKQVYAWKGKARHQEDSIRQVTYLGGAEQFYLPHLASDDESMRSDYAYMHSFTFTDSLW